MCVEVTSISWLDNCPSQEIEVTLTHTRPVENVVITTKGLQDRINLLLDEKTVENKGKLILSAQPVYHDFRPPTRLCLETKIHRDNA